MTIRRSTSSGLAAFWGLVVAAILTTSIAARAGAPSDSTADDSDKPSQAELEIGLADRLQNATLTGHFTVRRVGDAEEVQLTPEKYTLGEVRKLDGENWLISARIQYGEHDVTLPLTLPIQWAGDTPVIVVDKIGFPGLGTYSARVLIYEDHYAGFWSGGDHGGHLFGTIDRAGQ